MLCFTRAIPIAAALFWLTVLIGCGGSSGNGSGAVPVLGVSTTTLSFVSTQGSPTNPVVAKVTVANSGSGTLSFTTASDSPWLLVTPAMGTAPQDLQVSVVTGVLTSNSYSGHVTVTATGAQGSPSTVTVTLLVAPVASDQPFWQQWGSNPQHTGMVNVAGASLTSKLADIVYDPFVDQEKAENEVVFGEEALTVHEQAPVTDGSDVYMVMKTGSYTACAPAGQWSQGAACGPNTWNTMVWGESRFSWVGGQLATVWNFTSDWKPEPNATNFNQNESGLGGWEPVFHPLDVNGFIYVPGAAGTVWKVDKNTGTSVSHVNPFNHTPSVTAANTFVAGPLTADLQGNVYYNVIQLNVSGGDPWGVNDVAGAWLVKITPHDVAASVSFATLVAGAPSGTSLNCPGRFGRQNPRPALPWPPSSNAAPPLFPGPCGSQRPGVNVAPAVAPDGTIYTASRAHFDDQVGYLVAVNPDLTPKWAASLQNRLNDGCGVLLPIAAAGVTDLPNSCRNGATVGVDPTTNASGSGLIADQASSSPTVLPDGSVVFGVLDNYNYSRGHLFRFDSLGNFVGAFGFGWDSTPGIYVHDGTFSLVLKDNHYSSSAYCSTQGNPICQPTSPGPFFISQLDANLNVEWSFQSSTIDSGHPNGYEWCINMPAVDKLGNVYVNSEDGNVYELPQGNHGTFSMPTGKLFLDSAIGAAYTPISIGHDGKLYTQNNGHLFVVGVGQ